MLAGFRSSWIVKEGVSAIVGQLVKYATVSISFQLDLPFVTSRDRHDTFNESFLKLVPSATLLGVAARLGGVDFPVSIVAANVFQLAGSGDLPSLSLFGVRLV